MAEVIVRDGTWTFDGDLVRIVPGGDRRVHKLRQAVGELTVPLAAIAGVVVEPGRKGGRLRLRLRDGADPFLHVTGGKLAEDADPYRLALDRDSTTVAEYLVDEIRNSLLLEQITPGPCHEFLMRGPSVPLTATAGDGTVSFDGSRIRIEWTEWAEDIKKSAGPQEFALSDVVGVEWVPIVGWTNGFLRFRLTTASPLQPKHDLNCLTWGWVTEGGTTSMLAAAVVARLPHPNAQPASDGPPAISAGTDTSTINDSTINDSTINDSSTDDSRAEDDHDTVLRRLRELGDLHRDGVLTDDEFTAAKQALLKRL